MSTHKNIDRICAVVTVLALIITCIFICGEKIGITPIKNTVGYESRLFDTSKVHTIDITMDDWDSFIDSCQSEEYTLCNLVIDGESFKNVAIRGKGNTSLSNVSSMGSERYSFKVEFDHYNSGNSYYGLDKLSLNNIIQDNTYMKDYLTYRLMGEFSVISPLCSYVNITVGGENWGLYLAVEGVEDAFLSRNYGDDSGELYKPDSMSFGGGRGNGKDFDMGELSFDDSGDKNGLSVPDMDKMPDIGEMPDMSNLPDMDKMPDMGEMPNMDEIAQKGDFSKGGMSSSDVKLQYIDDDFDSYSNIFDNAKTDITSQDKQRLISSLKSLSSYEDIENVVDVEQVIRYFVVHNYVCNGDSYTGSMVHNYYLYEKDGQLSMIPWDYNLAFGTFQSSSATSTVNSPIDSPVSGGSVDDRPMIGWIFSSESYMQMYHEYFSEFIETVDIESIITGAEELISSYVESDPTKFCTYEEYQKGVATLKEFCSLRSESIKGQLSGSVPSTEAAQRSDSTSLIDASHITISDMGTMSMGGIGGKGDKPESEKNPSADKEQSSEVTEQSTSKEQETTDSQAQPSQDTQMPQGGQRPDMPGNAQGMQSPPEGLPDMPQQQGAGAPNMPEGEPGDMKPMENPGETTTEKTTKAANEATDEESTTQGSEEATTKADSNKDNRPQGGRNDKMPGGMKNAKQGIWSFVISIVLLGFGLVFAIVFKRRKDN